MNVIENLLRIVFLSLTHRVFYLHEGIHSVSEVMIVTPFTNNLKFKI